MGSKSVIVTIYFNLKELPDNTSGTRAPEFYMKAGRGTLQMDYPMVVFCDTTTRPLIQSIRDELIGPNDKTVYIERSITDYDFYRINWPIVRDNRKRRNKDSVGRNTASYYLLTTFKILALKIAEERNDFQGTHYFWIDFGCSHIVYNNTLKVDAIKMLE